MANDVEFVVPQGWSVRVRFSGLPAEISSGDVLFEPPRTVSAIGGSLTDCKSYTETANSAPKGSN